MTRFKGWATLFVVGSGLFVVSPLLPSVASDLAIDKGAAGWMVTSFAVGYIVAGPRLGALADRHGPRRVLVAALGLFAAANLATGLATGIFPLLLSRALAGLAASGVTPCVYALVSASAPRERRASWLAVTTSGMLSALAAGAPAGTLLGSSIGWRGVFVGVGFLAAAVLVLVLVLVGRRDGEAHRMPPTPSQPARVPVGHRARAVSTTALWAVAVYGLYTYLGLGLTDSAGLAPGSVAVALAGFGGAAVAGNLAGGVLADRYGATRVTVASLAALAVLAPVLGFAIQGDLLWVVLVLGLLAVAAYPYFTAHQLRLLAAFPDSSGTLLAWNNTALYVGILVGSALGSQIMSVASFSVLAWVLWAAAATGSLVSTRALPRAVRAVTVPEGS